MHDPEPLTQLAAGGVGEGLGPVQVGAVGELEVGGERRGLRVERPHVEVVHTGDTGHRLERLGDLLGVDAAGSRLEQHPDRLPQHPDHAPRSRAPR